MNAILSLLLLIGDPPATLDGALVPNYTRVGPELVVSGQPSDEGLERLKSLGFRTVINLRGLEEEGAAEERARVEARGLRYVSVPVTAGSLSRSDVDAVARVLADKQASPVLLHCTVGNRAAGMWAAVQASRGEPIDDAIAEAKKAGLRSEAMIEAVRRVAAEKP